MNYDLVVAMDNGNSGGMAAMQLDGCLLGYCANPVTEERGVREVDGVAVIQYIESFTPKRVLFAVEEPLKRLISSTPSMWNNYGAMRGICYGQQHWDFLAVPVNQWQKKLLGRVPKGKTKEVALSRAKKFWPEEHWLATDRSRVPHDGIVDAVLIAKYVIDQHNEAH